MTPHPIDEARDVWPHCTVCGGPVQQEPIDQETALCDGCEDDIEQSAASYKRPGELVSGNEFMREFIRRLPDRYQ